MKRDNYISMLQEMDKLAEKVCYHRNSHKVHYNGFKIKGYQVWVEYYNDYGVEFKDQYPLDTFLAGFEAIKEYIELDREKGFSQNFLYNLYKKAVLRNK